LSWGILTEIIVIVGIILGVSVVSAVAGGAAIFCVVRYPHSCLSYHC